jgi:hypothetical protein
MENYDYQSAYTELLCAVENMLGCFNDDVDEYVISAMKMAEAFLTRTYGEQNAGY